MKKCLIIVYSHTCQTEMAVASFARGLKESIEYDIVNIKPVEHFPFPWKMRDFFRAFPRCVKGLAPKIEPLNINWPTYEFVVLAYQVWFLSPSLPVQGFLQSPFAKGLKNKKVLTLVTCRNLWRSALIKTQKMLHDLGADPVGQVTLCERGPVWASFVTTPRWLLTGKKGPFWFFPAAGIDPQEFEALENKGRTLARTWISHHNFLSATNQFGANVESLSLAQMDFIGHYFFNFWANLILNLSKGPGLWQDSLLVLFRANLILLILITLPCTKLIEVLLGNRKQIS